MQTRYPGTIRRHGFRRVVGLTVLLGMVLLTAATAMAVENWFEMGLADLKEHHYPAAVEKFTKAIEAVPDDYEALNNRGFARIYTGDYEGAIDDCSRSIAINPGSAKGYNNRGFARLFTGDFDAAIEDFNQALTINRRYVDAYCNRCLAWTRKAVYTEAIADCTEALHLNPRSAKALYNRGYARDRRGNPGGAMRDYIQALNVNPNYIEVFNNMAWIMATSPDARLRDGRRAVAYAEKAVGHTADINFLDTLAAAYAENGRFDEAVAIENRIISLLASARQPDAMALHVHRMSVYEEGRPYREPIEIRNVSAITDLQGDLASLDALVFETAVTPAVYTGEQAGGLSAAKTGDGDEEARPMLLAQTEPAPPATVPEAYSQSVRTAPGVPVEITVEAETDGLPLTFEIETVPYQGSLRGTLPHLLYTPRPGFEGRDRFTFRARNAVGPSNLATVTITVAEPPPPKKDVPAPATPAEAPPAEDVAPTPEPAPIEESPLAAPETERPKPAPLPETEPPAAAMPPAPTPDSGHDDAAVPSTTPAPPAASAEPAPAPAEEPLSTQKTVPSAEPSPQAAYTIQVRSVKDAAGAEAVVARLRDEGYAAFSYAMDVPDKGIWHRVFINAYPTLEAARTALDKLDKERFKGAFVRRTPRGASMPAAAPAPEPALPAQAPAPEPARPAAAPTTEPSVPAAAPAPKPNVPARATTPEPSVPATSPAPEPNVPAAAPSPAPAVPASPGASPQESMTVPAPAGDDAETPAIAVAPHRFPYTYQVKSYQQREEAFQLGVELTSQGHKAFIGRGVMGSTGVWYRVYLGCYQTPEEAEKSRTDIAREGFPEAFLTPIAFAIAVQADPDDPGGNTLENRLMASGFLPYRLPADNPDRPTAVLVGGFRDAADAAQVLAALEQSGFKGEVRPR